jgi:hypothetical protein
VREEQQDAIDRRPAADQAITAPLACFKCFLCCFARDREDTVSPERRDFRERMTLTPGFFAR